MTSSSMFAEISHLRARLGKSEWIVCAEAIRLLDNSTLICGVVSNSGPNGEPLACGYRALHQGDHAWATLPSSAAVAAGDETKENE